jgi:hypothetical protein
MVATGFNHPRRVARMPAAVCGPCMALQALIALQHLRSLSKLVALSKLFFN